jgi:ribosome maturation factor RimP
MTIEEKRIALVCERVVEANGFVLVETNFRGKKGARILEAFIDGEKNVTHEDCARTSRAVSAELEADGLRDEIARLDVSSPGVDRPLKFPIQYGKHVGRRLAVETDDGKLEGTLLEADDDGISIDSAKLGEVRVPFAGVKKAFVKISL